MAGCAGSGRTRRAWRMAVSGVGAVGLASGALAQVLPPASAAAAPAAWSAGLTAAHGPAGLQAAVRRALSRPGDQRRVPGHYGSSVAVSGPTVLISGGTAQAVYVFVRSGRAFHLQARLPRPGGVLGGSFGDSVALLTTGSGAIAVVGAPFAWNGTAQTGLAFVFARSGRTWRKQATLTDPVGVAGDDFGASVAISQTRSGPVALIGAPVTNSSGVAYVFAHSAKTWRWQATLADPAAIFFGLSLAVAGSTAVLSAQNPANRVGRAEVFARSGGTWHRQATLADPDSADRGSFGQSVAVSGRIAVVGAPRGSRGRGVAYVFGRSGSTWRRQAKLVHPHAAIGDCFACAVAVSGLRVLIGAPRVNLRRCGTAYEFERSGIWRERAQVLNPGCTAHDRFGAAVAISGRIAVIGAPGKSHGAAYELLIP